MYKKHNTRSNNTIYLSLLFSLFVLLPSYSFAETPKKMGKVVGIADVVIPTYFKDSFLDFREESAESAEAGKHMLVFADLKGCPYCAQMLEDNFVKKEKEGGNREFIQKNFDSIHIDIKGSREVAFNENTDVTEAELAKVLQVSFTPTLLFLNANNKVVARVNGYRSAREFKQVLNYVSEKAYKKTDFPSYRLAHLTDSVYTLLNHNGFTVITDFQKALKSTKPLVILFEDETCDECNNFHKEILNLPETKALMKPLTFARLDALSNQEIIDTKGNKITPGEWLKKEGISYRPALLFFAEGEEKARLTGLIKSFHFQQLLSYMGKEKYTQYADFFAYGEEYSKKILESGKDIDIWK